MDREISIQLYVSYNSQIKIIDQSPLIPIHAGKAGNCIQQGNSQGDDTGINISSKNDRYCELTTQYWVWKNNISDGIVGFFHYRRFLDLRQLPDTGALHRTTYESDIGEDFCRRYELNVARCADVLSTCDVVLPRPIDVRRFGVLSVYEQYAQSKDHHVRDLMQVSEILERLAPTYRNAWDRVLKGTVLIPHNIFIAERRFLENYSGWLYPILFELEKTIPYHTYSRQSARALGFIAERLMTAYVEKHLSDGSLKVRFANLVQIGSRPPPTHPTFAAVERYLQIVGIGPINLNLRVALIRALRKIYRLGRRSNQESRL